MPLSMLQLSLPSGASSFMVLKTGGSLSAIRDGAATVVGFAIRVETELGRQVFDTQSFSTNHYCEALAKDRHVKVDHLCFGEMRKSRVYTGRSELCMRAYTRSESKRIQGEGKRKLTCSMIYIFAL